MFIAHCDIEKETTLKNKTVDLASTYKIIYEFLERRAIPSLKYHVI